MSNVVVASATEGETLPVGSSIFSAREICELALGQIGDYSVNDEGADPISMERALKHLDMILAEVAGTDLNRWLISSTFRFSWPIDTRVDTVANIMADAYPSAGIVMPIRANLLDADDQFIRELRIVRRWEYEEVSNKDDTGQPEILYFDRLADDATVSMYRVPDVATWQIDLVAQTFARSVLGTQSQQNQSGNLQHGMSAEWQRFLVNQLSADIGNGPVRRVSLANVRDWRDVAGTAFARLEVWANREKKSTPSRTKRWGS